MIFENTFVCFLTELSVTAAIVLLFCVNFVTERGGVRCEPHSSTFSNFAN